MSPPLASFKATTLIGIFLIAASVARAESDRLSAAHLAALSESATQAGKLIYRGATFAQKQAGPEPLFRYERRLKSISGGFEATHLTRDPAHHVVVVESAEFNAAYQLQSFAVQHPQLGYSGEVQVSSDGRHLSYRLNDRGVMRTAEESIDVPAVSGPSLFGFILAQRLALAAGKTVPVRFIVMKKMRTYGFEIRQDSADNGQVVYAITPSSWFIRMFIATMRVTWDTGSQTWVRYEGRVPPMQSVAGQLTELDARVDYTASAFPYR